MSAIEAIAAERQRQIEVEGWTPEHDDEHDDGQLAKAASCYALPPDYANRNFDWPWAMEWWKPSEDRRRELVKAAALIVAEIERLDRAALTALQVTERKTMRIVEADPIVLEDEQGIYGRVTEGDKRDIIFGILARRAFNEELLGHVIEATDEICAALQSKQEGEG
jgi:hypothetical protein